jgi:hypothetical protein
MVLPRLFQGTLRSAAVRLLSAGAAVIVALGGCGRKAANIQLQSAELEKAFPGLASVAPARTGQPATSGDPKAFVAVALSASRSNDYVTAVLMLQKAAESPGVTPEQVTALQVARKAWVTDLMTRAGRGDESAKAALAAIGDAH